MPRFIKRILTPLFFCIIVSVILCCSVFADGEAGIPYVSINQSSPVPFTSNLVFEDGDTVEFTSSGIVSFAFIVPNGVTVNIPSYVSLVSSSYFRVSGIVNLYGTLNRETSSAAAIAVNADGVVNQYFGSIINSIGQGVYLYTGGSYNMYGGTIISNGYGFNSQSSNNTVNIYGGTINGTGVSDSNTNVTYNGVEVTDNGEGEYTFNSDLLDTVSELVSSSVSWISSFVSSITSNILVLTFVLVIFSGLGIGIISRLKRV